MDGESGLLIPPGDIEALCTAIESLADDPNRRQKFGEAGRRIVEEKFTLQQAAAQYSEIYQHLLKGE